MKRIFIFSLCIFLILLLSGCFLFPKGIRIVGIGGTFRTEFNAKGAGRVMRERYVFSCPEPSAAYMLVAEDLQGHILTEGVTWSLADSTLGKLIPEPAPNEYIQKFEPARAGETTVTARNADGEDTAQIVVYPGWGWNSRTFPMLPCGFDFSEGKFIIDEANSDIWWPGNSKIRFEIGYWPGLDEVPPSLDNMESVTVEGKTFIDGPIDYSYYTDTDQLFLVRTHEGAIYAAIVTSAKLVYKPTPLIPAP